MSNIVFDDRLFTYYGSTNELTNNLRKNLNISKSSDFSRFMENTPFNEVARNLGSSMLKLTNNRISCVPKFSLNNNNPCQ